MKSMGTMIDYIMLVDDNKIDNFFHERVLQKNNVADNIIVMASAPEALVYLSKGENLPSLIFLDVNMPVMTGWEFIEEYIKLDEACKKSIIAIMQCDPYIPEKKYAKIMQHTNAIFICKPLTKEAIIDIVNTYKL